MAQGRLHGKTAFLTAAGQGIGRATALAFLREDARVIASDRDADALKALTDDAPQIETLVLDATDTEAVGQAAREAGAVDVLFNCAGYVHHGTVVETEEKDWDFSFDLNVKSQWRTLRAFLPGMVERGRGAIVNIGSAASTIKAAPNRAVYMATKAAVAALTKSVAVDYVKHGIRCNVICPGTVQSPSLEERIKAQPGSYDDNRRAFIDRQLMGRLASADEIANLAVYLASDEAAFVTGAEMVIDGGWSL